MSIMQCALALAALAVGLVHSWDFVTSTGNRLEFYTKESITHRIVGVEHTFNITALAYDAAYNTLLFVDKQSDNATIFSFSISTNKFESVLTRKNIEDIAFDPVKELLFWTDMEERSIFWISFKPGSENNVNGNLLIKMDYEIPMAIAVDSCRGYIYWTNINLAKPTIERARFNGSEREVLMKCDIYKPVGLAIDQQTKKMIWAEDYEGKPYNIQSSDLNGNNINIILSGSYVAPRVLTVSKDFIYIGADSSLWQSPKDSNINRIDSLKKMPSGIAANYKIEEQTQGIPECEALMSLMQINSAINDSRNIPTDVSLSCVHGTKINGDSPCKCTPGYTGESCNIPVQTDPKCRCSTDYSGERCEVNVCLNYCLNDGICCLNEQDEPVCKCNGNYEGLRCEAVKGPRLPLCQISYKSVQPFQREGVTSLH